MRSLVADGKARLLSWRRVREFAVPALMIKSATTRRVAGDWAGACAAAHVDVDLDLHVVASRHGREFAALVRADLRRLAPDLLRWHLPRTVSDGLLRPGLTMSLVRYSGADHGVHLVVRTAPSWADAGQRISLALWDPGEPDAGPHPRPRPDRRYRLDLHPHLWAADHAPELRERCDRPAPGPTPELGERCDRPAPGPTPELGERCGPPFPADPSWMDDVPVGRGFAVHRWVAEAEILRAADGYRGAVAVRLGNGRRLLLSGKHGSVVHGGAREPVLPHAATWMSPDLELLQAGMITREMLHPLVAAALAPAGPGAPAAAIVGEAHRSAPGPVNAVAPDRDGEAVPYGVRTVECCGEIHRLGLVDGKLTPLDHDGDELRREEWLAMLGGPPLPCLRAITAVARHPECLDEVRARLEHGDHTGAVALVVDLLGPGIEPEGALRDAFEDAEDGRIGHGLYRAGLAGQIPHGLTGPIGPRKERAGRRGRHHRLPKRAAALR
jgi:hypothetical protein